MRITTLIHERRDRRPVVGRRHRAGRHRSRRSRLRPVDPAADAGDRGPGAAAPAFTSLEEMTVGQVSACGPKAPTAKRSARSTT